MLIWQRRQLAGCLAFNIFQLIISHRIIISTIIILTVITIMNTQTWSMTIGHRLAPLSLLPSPNPREPQSSISHLTNIIPSTISMNPFFQFECVWRPFEHNLRDNRLTSRRQRWTAGGHRGPDSPPGWFLPILFTKHPLIQPSIFILYSSGRELGRNNNSCDECVRTCSVWEIFQVTHKSNYWIAFLV